MKNYEGLNIGDNVQDLKKCPKCGDESYKPIELVATPMVEGKRALFHTWTCFNCKTQLISIQD